MKSTYGRPKGKSQSTVESFAERIFISNPRLFSFSHRVLLSLRHPYTAVVVDVVDSDPSREKDRLEEILGALLQSRDEERKWTRVATMFDLKLTAEEIDVCRRKISLNPEIRVRIESLWTQLGGISNGVVLEEDYKAFHVSLYSYLLKIDSVSVATSSCAAIVEDFTYDKRGAVGVDFGSFAISMLELADNWTRTREVAEYIHFFSDIYDNCLKKKHLRSSREVFVPNYKAPVYFSGGLVCRAQEGDKVVFSRKRFV
ncbi:hypothetical protein TraAM80_04487 [Trypanosoma rangeli]|uniref:Uncharacterized protein n=1 Tax=Trypanosoma rangeli TaxID=5698 RepID=A0A422NJP5_TRYRA|nr:uncharacterized protein TraAM80_04487 [Trypanosoma rangeli]RNF05654.1 hypothetical protein TraAM80_04487 [Trypanosoma rangeli]|eukprot:RNF05654.1 hypothetical protein TraAM80_04487 [Trypanosoma rangeli]